MPWTQIVLVLAILRKSSSGVPDGQWSSACCFTLLRSYCYYKFSIDSNEWLCWFDLSFDPIWICYITRSNLLLHDIYLQYPLIPPRSTLWDRMRFECMISVVLYAKLFHRLWSQIVVYVREYLHVMRVHIYCLLTSFLLCNAVLPCPIPEQLS